VCVTARLEHMDFRAPVYIGNLAEMQSRCVLCVAVRHCAVPSASPTPSCMPAHVALSASHMHPIDPCACKWTYGLWTSPLAVKVWSLWPAVSLGHQHAMKPVVTASGVSCGAVLSNSASLWYVCVDPVTKAALPVPPFVPKSARERVEYEQGLEIHNKARPPATCDANAANVR
jgi:hypothetical protein